jgi:lysophospholipase L1-like esterase
MRALLAANRYDLVIWQVGVNDALRAVAPDAFAATLDEGIALIRSRGARVLLMDQQTLDAPDPARYARFVALVGAAAARHGAPLLPRHAVMAAWDAPTRAALMAADGLHHNDRGYACLAALTGAALTGAALTGPGAGD